MGFQAKIPVVHDSPDSVVVFSPPLILSHPFATLPTDQQAGFEKIFVEDLQHVLRCSRDGLMQKSQPATPRDAI